MYKRQETRAKRIDVDGVKITGVSAASKVLLTYRVLAAEMTCRANHLDESHVHIMPPYTWMLPTKGIASERLDFTHKIILKKPEKWTTAIQLSGKEGEWFAEGRDEMLDAIIESNSNPMISFEVEGCKQYLKLWDSGGHKIPEEGLNRFIDCLLYTSPSPRD